MLPLDLYARVRTFYPLHTRPRVQRAPGLPCALLFYEEGKAKQQASGETCREIAKPCSVVITRESG